MKENRLVRIALFLILVAFSLIYALYFMVQGDGVRGNFQTIFTRWGVINTGSIQTGTTMQQSGDTLGLDTLTQSGSQTGTITAVDNVTVNETPDSFINDVLSTASSGQKIFSGTKLYYGSLDILRTLGIRYEYILKDNNYNIYYVYVGKKGNNYNIPEILNNVGGKTIEIYAKNDIINNLYFGDRVTIATLPNQLSTQTNVFVRMGEDLWLIQDLTGQYKQNKRHIRYIFTNQ